MTIRIASLAATAALLALTPAAFAADVPVSQPPVEAFVPEQASFDWTGFYVGVYGGYAWANADLEGFGDDDVEGGLAGGTIGYNQQFGNWVAGIEADGGWAGIEEEVAGVSVETQWTSTVRGRIGYAFDNFMIYGTGGAAIADIDVGAPVSDNDTRFGWTAGGGVEAALTDNISAKAEYLYMDFGDDDIGGTSVDLDAHTVKGGLNFRF
jgi:outer membrane immunogenic protein